MFERRKGGIAGGKSATELKERLSVKEGKIYGDLDGDSNINTFTERPLAGVMVKGKGKPYSTGSEQVTLFVFIGN